MSFYLKMLKNKKNNIIGIMNIQCTIKKKQLDPQMLSILKRLHVNEMKDKHKLPQLESLFFKLQQAVMKEKIEEKQKQLSALKKKAQEEVAAEKQQVPEKVAALKKKAQEEAAAQKKQVQEEAAAKREQILKDEMLHMIDKFLKQKTMTEEDYADLRRQIENESRKNDIYCTILEEAKVNKKSSIEKIDSDEKSDIDKIHSDKKTSIKKITSIEIDYNQEVARMERVYNKEIASDEREIERMRSKLINEKQLNTNYVKLDEVEDFLQRSIKEKQVDVKIYDFLKDLLEKDKDFAIHCEVYEQLTSNPFEMVNAHKILKEREEIKKKFLEETHLEKVKNMFEKIDRSQWIEKLDEIYQHEKSKELNEFEKRWKKEHWFYFKGQKYNEARDEILKKYNFEKLAKEFKEKEEKKERDLKEPYLQEYFNKYINAVNKVFTENNIEILKDTLCEKVFRDSEYDCNSNKSIQYISNLKDLLSKNEQKINRTQYIQIIGDMINDQYSNLFQYNNHELFQYITQDINYFIAFVCVFVEMLNNKTNSKALDILCSNINAKNSIFKDMSKTQIIQHMLNDDYNKKIITLDLPSDHLKQIKEADKLISEKISKHKMELEKGLDKQIEMIKHLDEHCAHIENKNEHCINFFETEEKYISNNPQTAKNSLIDDKIVQYYKSHPNVVFRFLCMYGLADFKFDRNTYSYYSAPWAENGIFLEITRNYNNPRKKTQSSESSSESRKLIDCMYEDFSHQAKNKIVEAEKLLYSIHQLLHDYKTLINLYGDNKQSFLDLFATVNGQIKDNITNYDKNENIKASTQAHDQVTSFAFHTTINRLVLSALEGLKKDIKKFNNLIIDIKNLLINIVRKKSYSQLDEYDKKELISYINLVFNDKNAINNQFNQIAKIIDFPIEESKKRDEQLSKNKQLNPTEEFNNISKPKKLFASLGAGTGTLASLVAINKKTKNKSNSNDQGNMSNTSPIGTPQVQQRM